MLEKYLSSKLGEGGHLVSKAPRQSSFFSPEVANNFLTQIAGIFPRAHSVDLNPVCLEKAKAEASSS